MIRADYSLTELFLLSKIKLLVFIKREFCLNQASFSHVAKFQLKNTILALSIIRSLNDLLGPH